MLRVCLFVPEKPTKAKCISCDTEFSADLTVIKNHAKGEKHKKNVLKKDQTRKVSDMFKANNQEEDQVRCAEIKIAALIAEHNLPIRLSEHLVPLMQSALPDSKIAKKLSMGRTKTTQIITNVLGKYQNQKTVNILKYKKFSVLIDESTDISCVKNICVCVRYFDETCGRICSDFFDLIQCFKDNPEEANQGMTAANIYSKLVTCIQSRNIPLENLIGFGSDGCNTMFGGQNSVVSRLQTNLPGIVVQKCVCHSLHLVSSDACKVLPRQCEDLAREIFNFFKHSCKRQAQFLEFQHFCNIEPHKILRPSQTRWLSLSMVVNRILEQWNALMLYFNREYLQHRLQSSEYVFNSLNNIEIKLYYYFLQWILPKFSGLNEYFQNEKVVITAVYNRFCETYKSLLLSYLTPNYVNSNHLVNIDPKNNNEFINLRNIYLGIEIMKNIEKLDEKQKDNFLIRCREFLIISCIEMKKRFDFGDTLLYKISIFDPKCTNKPNSIYNILKELPRIINENDTELMQKIDDEWRLYCQCFLELPESILKESEIDVFWHKIATFTDVAGNHKFKYVGNFVLDVLVLPHSNATCERKFSKINLIKTKIRNKLCSKTISGLVLASEGVKDCRSFEVKRDHIELIKTMNKQDQTDIEDGQFEFDNYDLGEYC